MILNLKPNNIISAPTSPAKGVSGLLSRATSLTGSVTSTVQQIARATSQVASAIKDRHKILLIIDDHLIDWSKYFKGKRLIGDWDIKVEQGEFKDINLSANSELGTVVSIHTFDHNGFKVARTFRPDFVFIGQHIQDTNQNYNDIIIGLKYGLVPSINSLQSFYNFQDKAWVFANLLTIQRKQGKKNFPLIEQTFYPTYKDFSGFPKFPCVVKIGPFSYGLGKIKVDNINQYQDVRSILMITNTYCIIEPFIDAKCDFNVQKIGSNYKVFIRKSVSGNWKANVGSALLEQIPLNDRYKKWVEDVSQSFGGLDICSLEGIVSKDGKEYILKVRSSDMSLIGETQEEDRKNIVELITQRMNTICKNNLILQQSRSSITSEVDPIEHVQPSGKRSSIPLLPVANSAKVNPPMDIRGSKESTSTKSMPPPPSIVNQSKMTIKENPTNPFASSISSPVTINESAPNQPTKPVLNKRDSQSTIDEIKNEVDDTMHNLRKTFAGIFGDM